MGMLRTHPIPSSRHLPPSNTAQTHQQRFRRDLRQVFESSGGGCMTLTVLGPASFMSVVADAMMGSVTARTILAAADRTLRQIHRRSRRNALSCLLCDDNTLWRAEGPAAIAMLRPYCGRHGDLFVLRGGSLRARAGACRGQPVTHVAAGFAYVSADSRSGRTCLIRTNAHTDRRTLAGRIEAPRGDKVQLTLQLDERLTVELTEAPGCAAPAACH
jgi:hypothetical protein